jgi:hypothetical protein
MDGDAWQKYHGTETHKRKRIDPIDYSQTIKLKAELEILKKELRIQQKENLKLIVGNAQRTTADRARFNVPKDEKEIWDELRKELETEHRLQFYCDDNMSRWRGKLLYDYDYNQWVVLKPKTSEEMAWEASGAYEYGELN